MVYTTRDTANIHTPKCQQSKITRILTGTDTTANKSEYIIGVYPNTSPLLANNSNFHMSQFPQVARTQRSPHRNLTSGKGIPSHCRNPDQNRLLHLRSHFKRTAVQIHSGFTQLNFKELADSRPDMLRIFVLDVYCHNQNATTSNVHAGATDVPKRLKSLGHPFFSTYHVTTSLISTSKTAYYIYIYIYSYL